MVVRAAVRLSSLFRHNPRSRVQHLARYRRRLALAVNAAAAARRTPTSRPARAVAVEAAVVAVAAVTAAVTAVVLAAVTVAVSPLR